MGYNFEIIDFADGLPVKIIIHKADNYNLHWHGEIEIIVVLKGEITIHLTDNICKLEEDDLLLINSNEIHRIEADDSAENIVAVVQINLNHFKTFSPQIDRAVFDCCSNTDVKLKYADAFVKLKNCIAIIINALNKKHHGYMLFVNSFVGLLLAHLVDNFEIKRLNEDNLKLNNYDLERIKRIIEYIDENYHRRISLADISAIDYLNPHYMSHFFKNKLGISFQQYLSSVRVKKSCPDLLMCKDSIIDIAIKNGFANVHAFDTAFKKIYGILPNKYRKEHGKKGFEIIKLNLNEYNYLKIGSFDAAGKISSYFTNEQFSTVTSSRKDMCNISINFNENLGEIPSNFNNLTTFGRAFDLLRRESSEQLTEMQELIGFKHIRFHGIFNDEMKVVQVNSDGKIFFSFNNVNKIFDFLLSINLKPYVELTFIPSLLKTGNTSVFQYQANISMPNDLDTWSKLIESFLINCIERYGLDEVLSWYFEIWNEPDLLWSNSKSDFFNFFKATYDSFKRINNNLKLSGPSVMYFKTADSFFLDDFVEYINVHNLDFPYISYHIYGEKFPSVSSFQNFNDVLYIQLCKLTDFKKNIEFYNEKLKKLKNGYKEIHITEFNVSTMKDNFVLDTAFMAPFIAKIYIDTFDDITSLGYWTCSDIFEENNTYESNFSGGYGLMTKDGIKKPTFWAFFMLSKLGDTILHKSEGFIATKKQFNAQILLYNCTYFDNLYCIGDRSNINMYDRYNIYLAKDSIEYSIKLSNFVGKYKIKTYTLDRNNGSAFDLWNNMGASSELLPDEIEYLKAKSVPTIKTEVVDDIVDHCFNVEVEPHGLILIEIIKLF